MKTIILTAILSTLLFGTNSFANFVGPGSKINTVAEVKYIGDGTLIILEGQIIKKIGYNDYVFRDSTGKIKIEINDANWGNMNVTPNSFLRIYGQKGNGHLGNVDLVISKVEILKN